MKCIGSLAIAICLLAGTASVRATGATPSNASSFFHLEKNGARWTLIGPNGAPFYIRGVHAVRYVGDNLPNNKPSQYHRSVDSIYGGDQTAWAKRATDRLRAWNFNTIGASSDPSVMNEGMPYTYLLNLSDKNYLPYGRIPDVFSKSWNDSVMRSVKSIPDAIVNDKMLIGYFTDNELDWSGDKASGKSILDIYLSLPPDSSGYLTAQNFVKAHVPQRQQPDDKTVDAFRKMVATRYFQVTHDAIKSRDPDHLILGCRFRVYNIIPSVIAAMQNNVDVVSWNAYGSSLNDSIVRQISSISHLPLLISEFSFVGLDSKLPNNSKKLANGVIVPNQATRSSAVEAYVRKLESYPESIGYIWFKYSDDPPEGAWSVGGENFNWGLVDNNDKPWSDLTSTFTKINSIPR